MWIFPIARFNFINQLLNRFNQSDTKKVKIKYWNKGWNIVFVEPQLIKTNSTIGKTNIYKIELKDVPEGTIFYMKDINRWFTFDKKGNQRFF